MAVSRTASVIQNRRPQATGLVQPPAIQPGGAQMAPDDTQAPAGLNDPAKRPGDSPLDTDGMMPPMGPIGDASPAQPLNAGRQMRTQPTQRPAQPGAAQPAQPPAYIPPAPTGLRADTYTPGGDPRLVGAQDTTDAALKGVMGTDRAGMQNAGESKYRSVFGTGKVQGDFTVDPNVGFKGVNPTVNAASIDPNVQFRNVDPTVQARNVNTQVNAGPAVAADESARTSQYGTAQDQALAGLGGPNRTELAKQALADFQTQGGADLAQKFRSVGRESAKFGRMGLGDVNAELGSIQGDYTRDLLTKQNELARSVAEGDINDRYRTVDATSGLRSQEAGIDAGKRGESRIERDYTTNVDTDNVNRSLEDRLYQTGLDERNMTRGINERDSELGVTERNLDRAVNERGFKANLDADNYGRAAGERNLETALAEGNVGRQQQERDTRLGIATGNEDRAFDRSRSAIDAATDQTDRAIGDGYDQLGAAGSLEDRVFGQGQDNRNEFRTERGRQDQLARQTIEDRIKQQEMQQREEELKLARARALMAAGG